MKRKTRLRKNEFMSLFSLKFNNYSLKLLLFWAESGLTPQEVGLYFALFLSFLTLVGLFVAIVYFYWSKTGTEALKEDLSRSRSRYDDCKKDIADELAAHSQTRAELERAERRLKNCEDREEDLRKKDLRLQGRDPEL